MSRGRGTLQPTYDLIAGEDAPAPDHSLRHSTSARQPLRESQRFSQATRADDGNESIRKELHKLRYEIDSLKQERDLQVVRHEEALRAASTRAESEHARAQNCETASRAAAQKQEQLAHELEDVRAQSEADRDALERRTRSLADELAGLREAAEEKEGEMRDQEGHFTHQMRELQGRCEAAQRDAEVARAEREERASTLATLQRTVLERDEELERLQSEASMLKASSGDAEGMAVLKRELSEQVVHIKELETTNEQQAMQLRRVEERQKSIQMVEEEKRHLEKRLEALDQVNRELAEARVQRQVLEDERRTWTSYLENASDSEDLRFDSPEGLAKAFVQARVESLALIDELGKTRPELATKDETIESLESQIAQLRDEANKAQGMSSSETAPDAKARARLERQRALAVKEVDYLRAQLKMFDAEEAELTPEKYNEQQVQKMAEMQGLVDNYRSECDTMRKEMDAAQLQLPSTNLEEPKAGQKRQRTQDDEDAAEAERSAVRKLRKLKEELSRSETAQKVAQKELEAARTQIDSLKASSRTRILEFRDNPTAQNAAIKQATLNALRSENEALLSRLNEGGATKTGSTRSSRSSRAAATGADSIPAATADRLRQDLAAKEKELASADKKYGRLTESFRKRALEMREAVASILGWKLDILPNGRVRVRCMLDSAAGKGSAAAAAADEERSIVFDGEQGTMKVSGGPQSEFARELRGHMEYWLDGRGEVPCFLAAATLDFWEKAQGTTQV